MSYIFLSFYLLAIFRFLCFLVSVGNEHHRGCILSFLHIVSFLFIFKLMSSCMYILQFAYAHCIYSIFDYEIPRICMCNGALHVVNIKAQVREISEFPLPCSRSLLIVAAARRRDHLLRNFRTRNCARRGGQRSVRHGGIICDGSRIHSFAQEGNNGQD